MGKKKDICTVFVYNNILGIDCPKKSEGIINDITRYGQLGTVLDASKVHFSSEAIQWLKNNVHKGIYDIGHIDMFKTGEGIIIFSFLGFYKRIYSINDYEVSNKCDFSLLDSFLYKDVIIPEWFKRLVGKDCRE